MAAAQEEQAQMQLTAAVQEGSKHCQTVHTLQLRHDPSAQLGAWQQLQPSGPANVMRPHGIELGALALPRS